MLVLKRTTDIRTGITTEEWVEDGAVVTPEAQAALDAQNAATAQTYATNEATIASRVDAALTANDNFLAIASPTTAQAVAQVKVLTRECSGLIRLLRRKLDSTSGT